MDSELCVFRRFDQEFPIISANVEAKEIEAFRYLYDLRFLGGKGEAAFREKRLHLDFHLFQHFTSRTGDHESSA